MASRTPLLALVLALLACLSLQGPAQAQVASPSEDVATLKSRGDAAMDALRFGDALDAYERAFARTASPTLLYNMARAHEGLGHFAEALQLLERFEREAAPELRGRVPRLAELLVELRGRVATIDVTCNVDGARVTFAEKIVGATPIPTGGIRVTAARGRLVVTADGYAPFVRELDLAGGTSMVVDAHLTTAAAVAGEPASLSPDLATSPLPEQTTAETPITGRWWFWAGLGAVVAGGVVVGVVATRRSAPEGSINPKQVSAPLVWF